MTSTAIKELLELLVSVDGIEWADMDKGQLDKETEFATPAALVSYKSEYDRIEFTDGADLTIKLIFRAEAYSATYATGTSNVDATALNYMLVKDLVVHTLLNYQGKHITGIDVNRESSDKQDQLIILELQAECGLNSGYL
jgi:hypothetical protein